MKPEEFIADLFELKGNILAQTRQFDFTSPIVENNTTYSLMQTLIALFCDKYDVNYEQVLDILTKRKLEKDLTPPTKP